MTLRAGKGKGKTPSDPTVPESLKTPRPISVADDLNILAPNKQFKETNASIHEKGKGLKN